MKVFCLTGKNTFYQVFIGDGTAKAKLGFQGIFEDHRNMDALRVLDTPSQFRQEPEANHEFPTLRQVSLGSVRLLGLLDL
jgi:hypothetical protein